ncbi:trehalose-phosphatase [Ruania alkalisoli]|nr:trehalose-phosphatase [Ruania alkalisoli]
MTTVAGELPDALGHLQGGIADSLRTRIGGRPVALFLDYDGVLAEIVDRPEDATISDGMRDVVADLAQRCQVCVVSGRDRPVVQELMRLDSLIVAGSHGFDIASPDGEISAQFAGGHENLLESVRHQVEAGAREIPGATVEVKAASVALHYRLVDEIDRWRATALVEEVRTAHLDELKVTPGKMVYEVQPAIDWDKGKAVDYLIRVLEMGPDVVPIYLGDDFTDEHAFTALRGRGIGLIVVGAATADADRVSAAEYRLDGVAAVQRFLDLIAR